MKPTLVPTNMQYLFESPDYLLSQEDFHLLTEKHNRAKNLNKNNGSIYPGLTQSAVFWLSKAYFNQTPINKKAFTDTIKRLSQITKHSHR